MRRLGSVVDVKAVSEVRAAGAGSASRPVCCELALPASLLARARECSVEPLPSDSQLPTTADASATTSAVGGEDCFGCLRLRGGIAQASGEGRIDDDDCMP
uniref:Uncharacterized protein n=1 Tax=Chlamydomonas euryale TaxID=1486919 RepID=A0A7R9VVK5_9CHLO|mmetsp:Transcript_4716/g.14275  ORF Transcript_4716/g.14275 Transcript_4716/m.14275 type:complete len:101 (+) Transcript_4716:309-611(+)